MELASSSAGLQPPTTGEVTVLGRPVDTRSADTRRAVAALIGPPSLAPDLTLREQLRYVQAAWGASADAGDLASDGLLAEFGIAELRDRYPFELSSGQSQLFQLALGFARPGRLRILDEPEQRLDAARRARVAAAIRARTADGTAVVFATHSTALAAEVGAREVTVGSDA